LLESPPSPHERLYLVLLFAEVFGDGEAKTVFGNVGECERALVGLDEWLTNRGNFFQELVSRDHVGVVQCAHKFIWIERLDCFRRWEHLSATINPSVRILQAFSVDLDCQGEDCAGTVKTPLPVILGSI